MYSKPAVLDYEELRGLLELGPWDCAYGVHILEYGMGHGPHPTLIVTIRTGVRLVRIEGNYSNSSRVGLLSYYRVRTFM
jgi:hypothetical protein